MEETTWVWVNIIRTGNDLNSDSILKIDVALSNPSLTNIIEGPSLVIRNTQHEISPIPGLTDLYELALRSPVSIDDATHTILQFLRDNNVRTGILSGFNIQMDRVFLGKKMSALFEECIDPVNIMDVSTFQELARIWYNVEPPNLLIDNPIFESIEKLRYYRDNFFNNPQN